ncbi:MAG: DUF3343 domain-containing protein [Coriobacteriia bacterium]
MSDTRTFVAYGFATTHDALTGEQLLDVLGVGYATIPAPRALGAPCGIALRVIMEEATAAEAAFTMGGLAWTGRVEFEDRTPGR